MITNFVSEISKKLDDLRDLPLLERAQVNHLASLFVLVDLQVLHQVGQFFCSLMINLFLDILECVLHASNIGWLECRSKINICHETGKEKHHVGLD